MMKIFLQTNAQGKSNIQVKTARDSSQNSWLLMHMIAQIARFGLLDLRIRGRAENPIALAKTLGGAMGQEIRKIITKQKGSSLFFWPFEQSLSIVRIVFSQKPHASIQTDIYDPQQKRILKEFYRTFARGAGMNIIAHSIDTGRFSQKAREGMMYNTHHQFEGLGKAFGRVLRAMTEKEGLTLLPPKREQLQRVSQETNIDSTWELHGFGRTKISMSAKRDPDQTIKVLQEGLKKFGMGGKFNLSIKASGDDEHHLYEDTAIILGNLLNQLLGQRKGIIRTAWSVHAIRGGLALVAIDLGRGYCHIETEIKNQALQSMVHHYFESFSRFAKLDIVALGIQRKHPFARYIRSLLPFMMSRSELKRMQQGRLQDRQLASALFEGFGMALGEAIRVDLVRAETIPSTKGIFD